MARITANDCTENIDDRFKVVLVAAKRARDLADGKVASNLESDNEKYTVTALREIAKQFIDENYL